jgi:hypothetical protein
MNQSSLALAFQAADDSSMMIIVAVVLVILFFLVVIVAVGLVIFFVMRKRSKAAKAAAQSDLSLATGSGASPYAGMSAPDTPQVEPAPAFQSMESPAPSYDSPAPSYETPATSYDPPAQSYETPAPAYDSTPAAYDAPTRSYDLPATTYGDPVQPAASAETVQFDPSRTVAIIRENTVPISYGKIKFTSGVLSGQEFEIDPEGAYIGRESTLSQIVVGDPRISKRHLWIGVRDGVVKVVDHDSRNGTFLNDPKSERITEAALNSGDTVIMGESDVARFEFHT